MPGSSGARIASSGSAACSPSRCGIATATTLFLARDRLGVKPLHYALLPSGLLLFGSELKSLVAHPEFKRDLDPVRDRGVLRPRLHSRAAHDLRRRPQAAPGAHADDPARPARCPSRASTGMSASRSTIRSRERDAESRTGRAPARIDPVADDRRGAARRVPVRRSGLERRRRDDGRRQRRAGQHLLDLLQRSGLRRIEVRAAGGRAVPHPSLRRHGRKRRFRPDRRARADL